MTVSKTHTWQAGKRTIVVGSAFFCLARRGASTLVITHSPSSVFHLRSVPDPQRCGSRHDWVNFSDELQYPWSPHWLLFSVAEHLAGHEQEEWQASQGRADTGPGLASVYSEPWGEPAVRSSQSTLEDCSPLLSGGVAKCGYVRTRICVGRLGSEGSSCQTKASVDCPGRSQDSLLELKSTWFILGVRMWAFGGVIFIVCWSGEKTCQ